MSVVYERTGVLLRRTLRPTARQPFRAEVSPLSDRVLSETTCLRHQIFEVSDSLRLCRHVRAKPNSTLCISHSVESSMRLREVGAIVSCFLLLEAALWILRRDKS